MKRLLMAMLIAGLLDGGFCFAAKKETPDKTDTNSVATQNRAGDAEREGGTQKMPQGYLGIAIEPLHSRFLERLERLFGRGQGVLVARVAEGSPAAEAGLQANDVVVTYDDQKIYSPVQLDRLVQNEKPGREVTLGIFRAGESREIKVQMGDRADAIAKRELKSIWSERPRRLRKEVDEKWSSFDSLVLERTGENRFKAAIKYRDTNGKSESREFQGTIASICKDVEAQHDMPTIERQQLLRALSSPDQPLEFDISQPRVASVPGTNGPKQGELQEVEWTFFF